MPGRRTRIVPRGKQAHKRKRDSAGGVISKEKSQKDVEASFTKKRRNPLRLQGACYSRLKEQKLEVLDDSGYFRKKIRKALHKKGAKPRIIQRRVRGESELNKTQKYRNQAIVKRRCRIEHIFGTINQFVGTTFLGVGLRRCKVRQYLVFRLYNIKRFCFLKKTGQLCPEIGKILKITKKMKKNASETPYRSRNNEKPPSKTKSSGSKMSVTLPMLKAIH